MFLLVRDYVQTVGTEVYVYDYQLETFHHLHHRTQNLFSNNRIFFLAFALGSFFCYHCLVSLVRSDLKVSEVHFFLSALT